MPRAARDLAQLALRVFLLGDVLRRGRSRRVRWRRCSIDGRALRRIHLHLALGHAARAALGIPRLAVGAQAVGVRADRLALAPRLARQWLPIGTQPRLLRRALLLRWPLIGPGLARGTGAARLAGRTLGSAAAAPAATVEPWAAIATVASITARTTRATATRSTRTAGAARSAGTARSARAARAAPGATPPFAATEISWCRR